ncbi:winged helix-turn-helix domain-containing protein [soil metagenome]
MRAQLLDAGRPTDLVDTVQRLSFVQWEPTAAIAPTADLVLFSRLGDAYRPDDLTAALEHGRTLFELNLLIRPMQDLALFKAAMHLPPESERTERWLDDNEPFRLDVLERLEADGPLTAREIDDTSLVSWPSSGWNNNRNVMMMLEALGRSDEIAVSARRGRDRLWDLAERVYDPDIPTLPLDEANAILNARHLSSQGVVNARNTELPTEPISVGESGVEARIEGLRGTWRVDPDALDTLDEPFVGRTALLSPFDGLIRDRKRMLTLFEFDYSLEMYKPAAKRRWGYYALPILGGDRLIGKVDAAADRDAQVLQVHAIREDAPFDTETMDDVKAELAHLARWLGLRLAGTVTT